VRRTSSGRQCQTEIGSHHGFEAEPVTTTRRRNEGRRTASDCLAKAHLAVAGIVVVSLHDRHSIFARLDHLLCSSRARVFASRVDRRVHPGMPGAPEQPLASEENYIQARVSKSTDSIASK
jgi:hypothetical protein